MATYLITGASRGIGFELTKQLLELPSSQVAKVFAVCRSDSSVQLRELIEKNPDRVIQVLASVEDLESVRAAAVDVETKLGNAGLDVLVNNAGIQEFSPGGTKDMPPEQLAHSLDINLIGPHRMISTFLPLLEKGKQKKVINISTSVGSISWAERYKAIPSPAYKISKSAINMLNTQYALDYEGSDFTFLLVSPGWLKTDMCGPTADLEVREGVAEVKRIILESDKTWSGKFMNINIPHMPNTFNQYDGKEIPW